MMKGLDIKSMHQFFCLVITLTIKVYLVIVEFKQSTSVSHCKQSYIQLFSLCIQFSLEIHTHCTCAFIKNTKNRSMIEKSSHCDSLLLSS